MKILIVLIFISFVLCQDTQQQNTTQNNQQYTVDSIEAPTIDKMDQIIKKEIQEVNKIMVNNKHSQHYGYIVTEAEHQEFIFAVDVDEEMEAVIVVYWEQQDNFVVSKAVEGEDVKVTVYENSNYLIGAWEFYHAAGISFHAKKEHEYLMKIQVKGRNKMLVMDVQNFVYKGSSLHVAGQSHIKPHQQRMLSIKDRLQSFMSVVETNHIINELVSQNVILHMTRYMIYQVVQCIIIFGFAIAQVYFIRKMLTKGYHSLV